MHTRRITQWVFLLCSLPLAALADARLEEKTHVELGGMAGKVANVFGGKALREGVITTTWLRGDRKLDRHADRGELIDLAAETVTQLDYAHKTYTVQTFDEIRQQMRDALERATTHQAERPSEPAAQWESEVDVSETGKIEKIAGSDCREVVLTVTTHPKGKRLEEAGGAVLSAQMWIGPQLPEKAEEEAFATRYWKKLALNQALMQQGQQLAAAMALNPALGEAMKKLSEKRVNLRGTAMRTTLALESVTTAAQAQQAEREDEEARPGLGGVLGGLAKRLAKKDKDRDAPQEAAATPSSPGQTGVVRTKALTSTTEITGVGGSVADADVAVPAGFKRKS